MLLRSHTARAGICCRSDSGKVKDKKGKSKKKDKALETSNELVP